jgi:hypothetical protein
MGEARERAQALIACQGMHGEKPAGSGNSGEHVVLCHPLSTWAHQLSHVVT